MILSLVTLLVLFGLGLHNTQTITIQGDTFNYQNLQPVQMQKNLFSRLSYTRKRPPQRTQRAEKFFVFFVSLWSFFHFSDTLLKFFRIPEYKWQENPLLLIEAPKI
jgi:hypothetical protein